jgi:hypothetical protein
MCSVPFPANNEGLVSNELSKKSGYLVNLWPGHVFMARIPCYVSDPISSSAASEHTLSIEKKLLLFYCQMFFNYFR